MFPYLRTAKEFINDCNHGVNCESKDCNNCDSSERSDLVNWLIESVEKSNWKNPVAKSEIKSWCVSVCFYLKKVLEKVGNDNLAIGLEFYLETRDGFKPGEEPHYRADVMIAGYGKKPINKIIVMELKRHDKAKFYSEGLKVKYYYKYNNNYYYKEESPAEQVNMYCNNLDKAINQNGKKVIELIPCVYMHDLKKEIIINKNNHEMPINNNVLQDIVCYKSKPVNIYLNESEAKLVEFIKKTFNNNTNYDGREVFRELRRRYKTFSKKDLANIAVCDDIEIYKNNLRPDQYFVLNGYTKNNDGWDNYINKQIDYLFNNNGQFKWKKDKNNEYWNDSGNKGILDLIQGGPGSGKTFLAMMILRDCLDRGLNITFVYEKSAPINAIFGQLRNKIIDCVSDGKLKEELKKENLLQSVINRLIDEEKFEILPEKVKWLKNLKIIYVDDFIDSEVIDDSVYIMDEVHSYTNKDVLEKIDNLVKNGKLIVCLYDKKQVVDDESKEIITGLEKKIEKKSDSNEVKSCNKYSIWSQFRCNKNDGFLTWLDYKLKNLDNECVYAYPDTTINSSDFDATIIDLSEGGELDDEIINEIKKGNIQVLAGSNVTDLKKYFGENIDVGKWNGSNGEVIPFSIEGQKINVGYLKDIRGIEAEEVLVFVEGIYNNNKLEAKESLKNEYRILLTRGLKKCYIVCLDKDLKEYLEGNDLNE